MSDTINMAEDMMRQLHLLLIEKDKEIIKLRNERDQAKSDLANHDGWAGSDEIIRLKTNLDHWRNEVGKKQARINLLEAPLSLAKGVIARQEHDIARMKRDR